MSGRQWLGAALLLAIFALLFMLTAYDMGWQAAALLWAGSIALAAILLAAVIFLVGDDR